MFTRCWKKVSPITNVHYKSVLYIEVFLWEFDRDTLLPDVRYIACPLQTSLTVEAVVQKCYIKEAFSKAAACKFPSKESLLKNFAKSKGKHLCWSLFFNINIVVDWRPATWLQRNSGVGVFLCFYVGLSSYLEDPEKNQHDLAPYTIVEIFI